MAYFYTGILAEQTLGPPARGSTAAKGLAALPDEGAIIP
jgi:hypothetical protein